MVRMKAKKSNAEPLDETDRHTMPEKWTEALALRKCEHRIHVEVKLCGTSQSTGRQRGIPMSNF